MVFSLTVVGEKRLRDRLGRFAKGTTQIRKGQVRDVAMKVSDRAKFYARQGEFSTGKLADSILAFESKRTGFSDEWSVEAGDPKASFVEEGTSAHPIFGDPFLHFFWVRAGGFVTLNRVNHPGARGKFFMRRAVNDFEPLFVEGMRVEVQDLINKFNRGGNL